MTEELSKVLTGKQVLIKNSLYLSANDYIQPFVDRLSPYTKDFRCQVKTPEQVPVTGGEPDLVYNRVNIQAVFPAENGYSRVIGMTYGLDLKKPVVKFYRGVLDTEHENFITFDKDALVVQEIFPETPFDYSCIASLMEATSINNLMIEQLHGVYLQRETLKNKLGEWVDFVLSTSGIINLSGKVKIAASHPVDAYKALLKTPNSEFYVESDTDPSLYEVYMSLLGIIRDDDKDIVNKFEKTVLVNRMLEL